MDAERMQRVIFLDLVQRHRARRVLAHKNPQCPTCKVDAPCDVAKAIREDALGGRGPE